MGGVDYNLAGLLEPSVRYHPCNVRFLTLGGTTLKRHRNSTKKSAPQSKKKVKARGKAGTSSNSLDPKTTDDVDPVSDAASNMRAHSRIPITTPNGIDDLFGLISRTNIVKSENRPVRQFNYLNYRSMPSHKSKSCQLSYRRNLRGWRLRP